MAKIKNKYKNKKIKSAKRRKRTDLSMRQSSRKNGVRPAQGSTVNGIIISEAMKNEKFREKVIQHIVDNLS